MATVRIPSSVHARNTRIAISPGIIKIQEKMTILKTMYTRIDENEEMGIMGRKWEEEGEEDKYKMKKQKVEEEEGGVETEHMKGKGEN